MTTAAVGLWERLADYLETTDVDALRRWEDSARPEQIPPDGTWRWWLACAGRGWGKTRACAEWTAKFARRYPGARIALVAATFADGRDTMVEGDSGLLSVLDPWELRGGSRDSAWNRSMGELFLANGSRFKIYSSEKANALRGPQFHACWGDEPAYWLDASLGAAKDSTFSNLNIALRLPARKGWDDQYRPQGVLATTPRRVALLKVPDQTLGEHPERAGLLQRADTVTVRGKTMDNVHNLSRDYYDSVIAPLIGTTLGTQELDGILLEDVDGALWMQAQIDADRRPRPDDLGLVVVAFDPAGGGGAGHDEHGIVVVGGTGTRNSMHAYILDDLSLNGSPSAAATTVIAAAFTWEAHEIVFEKNQGQDWIPSTITLTFSTMLADPAWAELLGDWRLPPIVAVTATKSKEQRATPVQMLSQQHRLHDVGTHAILDSQRTTWVPGESDSPDRLDAMVWGVLRQLGAAHGETAVASAAARERRGRRASMPSTQLPAVYGYRSNRG